MPGDGTLIFQNMPEMVEGEYGAPDLWPDGDEWGIAQSDQGLGALVSTEVPRGGGVFSIPGLPTGAGSAGAATSGGATTGCSGSDWIALGYPTKQIWKQLGRSCAPYQGVSAASCPTGFQIDPNSGQCMPIQPAPGPFNPLPPNANPTQCQLIPAGQVGSCLSPISQGQIGTVPGAISTTSGVFTQLEGFFFQHSTLILIGVGLYLLWPTLTKKRR